MRVRGVREVRGVRKECRARLGSGSRFLRRTVCRFTHRVEIPRILDGTRYASSSGMVKSHKDLICWQLCARLRSLALTYIRGGPANKDFEFRGQMRRAARSNCYQTSEGFYSFDHPVFARYLDGAYASLGETLDQIDDGHEQRYFTDDQQVEMRRLARRAMKANRSLAAWLRSNPTPSSAARPSRPSRSTRTPRTPSTSRPPEHTL